MTLKFFRIQKLYFSKSRIKKFQETKDVDVDVERKQAQAIASLPDSITQLSIYSCNAQGSN